MRTLLTACVVFIAAAITGTPAAAQIPGPDEVALAYLKAWRAEPIWRSGIPVTAPNDAAYCRAYRMLASSAREGVAAPDYVRWARSLSAYYYHDADLGDPRIDGDSASVRVKLRLAYVLRAEPVRVEDFFLRLRREESAWGVVLDDDARAQIRQARDPWARWSAFAITQSVCG